MNINRNNCEAFFLDYYEGTLNDAQVAEMFAFLKANPELREVFESFGDISVNDETTSVPDFSFLKKETVADDHAKAEQWMVDFTEGTITDEDRAALEKYLIAFPEKKRELDLFAKTILHADAAEQFGDVSSLKKSIEISASNFDDFAIALIEGTISTAELDALEKFVAANPEFSKELEAYRASRLIAEDHIQFEHKDALRRTALLVNEENIAELLIAKAEGTLTAVENQEVDAFIARFPEYRIELEAIRKTKLVPDPEDVFGDKSSLKKSALIINENNFEQHMISATEGLLNEEELKSFNAFVASSKKYQNTLALYAATRVQPDLNIVYDDKEELKRKQRGGFISWSAGIRYAAAAVLVLMFGLYLWNRSSTSDVVDHGIANNQPAQQNNSDDVVPVVPEQNPSNEEQLVNANPETQTEQRNTQVTNRNVAVQDIHGTINGTIRREEWGVDNFVAARNDVKQIPAAVNNDQVQYSTAFYDAMFAEQELRAQNEKEYISPGQFAMRWMKDKIDGPNQDELLADNPDETIKRNRENDPNVDGLDLTQSAVNRVGEATGGKISMDQGEDGTYLHLWNYSVRVSQTKR